MIVRFDKIAIDNIDITDNAYSISVAETNETSNEKYSYEIWLNSFQYESAASI